MKKPRLMSVALAYVLIIHLTTSEAALLHFMHEWSGDATASGHITFDDTLLNNPGNNMITNGAIVAFNITVTGARAGNGTFVLNDFTGIILATGGLPLDFTRELVGQPTDDKPWGTVTGNWGDAGHFMLDTGGIGSAPQQNPYFSFVQDLGDGGGSIYLTSLKPIPLPPALWLFGTGLLGMVGIYRRKKAA